MDYSSIRSQWSTCSIEDFTAYYSQFDNFCLKEIEEEEDETFGKLVFSQLKQFPESAQGILRVGVQLVALSYQDFGTRQGVFDRDV